MCVGIKIEDPLKRNQSGTKQSNNEERKEKAKDAARTRRMLESDYFEELEKLLPITEPPPSSQQAGLHKISIIRLNIAQLKVKDFLQNGINLSNVKEEIVPNVDLFSCLDGFSLLLGSGGDVIYVSENVSRYIGLTQVELLGQQFSDYVHPCDHNQIKLLIPRIIGSADENVEIFVRVKCTVTERGRMINLKQASYKPLKISGKARCMPEKEVGGVRGTVFLGSARYVVVREGIMDTQIGVFTTKHSVDMKFMEADHWMSSIAGYNSKSLLGFSFYDLVHAQDIGNVQKSFKYLVDHGQCETPLYRLLCHGGGYVWLQTKACLTNARQGSNKGQSILCSHQQISEVLNREEILSTVQMKNKTHLVKSPSYGKDAVRSFAHTDINETRNLLKAITIKPPQNPNFNSPIITSCNDKKIVNEPTSVIVKCAQRQSEFVSVPVIQKSSVAVQKEEFFTIGTRSKETYWGNTDLNTTTQSIFEKSETIQGAHNTSELLEELLPIINLNKEHKLERQDNDFLENILDDMERRSPHSGDQCVSIENKDSKKEKITIGATSFDNIQVLNFDDNLDVEASNFLKPIEKLTFDETQVLIDPNKNTMWGTCRQSIDPYGHLQHNRGEPGHAIWNEGARKRCQSDFTSQCCPEHLQSRTALEQKQRFWRNSSENCLEPPGEKIIMWGKNGKQNTDEQESGHGFFNKRFKFSMESKLSGSSVIKLKENTTNMDQSFYKSLNSAQTRTFNEKVGNSHERGQMFQTYHDYQKCYL